MQPHRFHTARPDRPSSSKDLVTLWTLERSEGQAVALAETWRTRLRQSGWR